MEDEIIKLFGLIERKVNELEYGTISGNILISKGLPVTKTLNLVLSKRKRYKVDNKIDKNGDST
jgi:hypothetical protein